MSDSVEIGEVRAELNANLLVCEEVEKTAIEFPATPPPPTDDGPTCLFCLKSKNSPANTPVKDSKTNAATTSADGDDENLPPSKKIKKEDEENQLIPLPCACNLNNSLAYVHQDCHDNWMLANVKEAACPRCRKATNLTRKEINEIRARKGLPIEKTVTTLFSFSPKFLHLSSPLFFSHSFQYRCQKCSYENISVTILLLPSTFHYSCNRCGNDGVLACYCGCEVFRYTSYNVDCTCPNQHTMPNVTYICTNCDETYNNYEESLFDEFLERYDEFLCPFYR